MDSANLHVGEFKIYKYLNPMKPLLYGTDLMLITSQCKKVLKYVVI